jgi:hypothetical protein
LHKFEETCNETPKPRHSFQAPHWSSIYRNKI